MHNASSKLVTTPLTFEPLGLQKPTIAQNDGNYLRISNFIFVYLNSCKKIDKSQKKWEKLGKIGKKS